MKPVSKFERYREKWQELISYHKSVGEDGQRKLAAYGDDATKYWTVRRFYSAGLLSTLIIGASVIRKKNYGLDIVLDLKMALLTILLFKSIYFSLWFFKIANMLDEKFPK